MYEKKYYLKDLDQRFKDSNTYFVSYQIEYNNDYNYLRVNRPAMLVLPGGGYGYTSNREGEPVALRFLCEGFQTFVLYYSVNTKYSGPHNEVAFVINYINEHNDEFQVTKHCISIVGFSAGGHLVTSYGFTYKEQAKELGYKEEDLRPFVIVSGYPVTLAEGKTHEGTIITISGGDKELARKLDVPSHVTSDYPPSFVWSTEVDEVVPIVNTYCLKEALDKNHVLNKVIVYKKGIHGGSLCTRAVYLDATFDINDIAPNKYWVDEASKFIFDLIKG